MGTPTDETNTEAIKEPGSETGTQSTTEVGRTEGRTDEQENECLLIAPGVESDVTNEIAQEDEAESYSGEDLQAIADFKEELGITKLEARVAFLEEFLSKTHGHNITKA